MAKRRYAPKHRIAQKGEHLVCAGCGERITHAYVRDLTKQPWHKACRRLGVSAKQAATHAPARYEGLTTTECGGCGMDVAKDDERVTLAAVPWHRECFMRR